MAAGKRTTYAWSPTISSSGLTKKQINRKIKEMEKRGYDVPQNIREQIAFSNSDTLKGIERKIAEKSRFKFYTYEMEGGLRKKGDPKENYTTGAKAYELEKKARAYNAQVQRLQNLKQYKGEKLAWTKIDIRQRNIESEEVLEKLEKRFAKKPSEIVAFERGKTTLPWDNFVKSLNTASALSEEERALIFKAMEGLGYKEAALSWHKKDSGNKFEELVNKEIAKGGGKKGGDIWVLYASGTKNIDNATSDLINNLILDNGMDPKAFLDNFGPATKKEKIALAKKLAGRKNIHYTVSDFLGEKEDKENKKLKLLDDKKKASAAQREANDIAKIIRSFEKNQSEEDMALLQKGIKNGAELIKTFTGESVDPFIDFLASMSTEKALTEEYNKKITDEARGIYKTIQSFATDYNEYDDED